MADEARDALVKIGLPRGDVRATTAAAFEGVDGVADFATLLLDLKWFDAALLTSVLAEGVARLLKGQSADALRTLLVADDELGDQEKEAALSETLSLHRPLLRRLRRSPVYCWRWTAMPRTRATRRPASSVATPERFVSSRLYPRAGSNGRDVRCGTCAPARVSDSTASMTLRS